MKMPSSNSPGMLGIYSVMQASRKHRPSTAETPSWRGAGLASRRATGARCLPHRGAFTAKLASSALFPVQIGTDFQRLRLGVTYYGYRYYDPNTGRWPSRDPIEEGAIIDFNLYAFTANRSANRIDFLGLRTEIKWEDYWKQYQEKYPNMTDQQRRWSEKMLSLGCKGVTCLGLGDTPKHNFCYKTKEAAINKQKALNQKSRGCCAKVYSIHFWNDGKNGDSPEVTFSKEGKADMDDWDESSQPGKNWMRFDFGFLNPDGTITHANHYYNPEDPNHKEKGKYYKDIIKYPITDTNDLNIKKIYISSLDDWKKSYPDFNEEVWCAQCTGSKSGVK